MDRLRCRLRCDICNQPSWMGWLYVCSQDESNKALITSNRPQQQQNDQHSELHALRFSRSVITQYQSGVYTEAQMQIIKEQKQKVQDTIAATIRTTLDECRPSTITRDGSKKRAALSRQHSLGVPHKRDLSRGGVSMQTAFQMSAAVSPANFDSYTTNLSRTSPPCDFRCCHRCRPFLHERLPYSLNAVLEGDVSAPSPEEFDNTHVIDAEIASNFGLKNPPRPILRTIDSRDADVFEVRPVSSFSSMCSIASTLELSSSESSLASTEEVAEKYTTGDEVVEQYTTDIITQV